jgi:hypothetical protein
MGAVDEAGGSAFLLTLTVRRDRGGRLGLTKEERARLRRLEENRSHYEAANSNLWHFDEREAEADAIEDNSLRQRKGCWDFRSDAWARVTSGDAWQADQELFGGLLGWARVVEVTDGENGWHVHIHALICFGEQVSTELVAGSVGARMFARWRAARRWRSGLLLHQDRPRGQRVAPQGGPPLGGRTPMQLLADVVDTYEETAMARWWEWEKGSEGRRQLTWSSTPADARPPDR